MPDEDSKKKSLRSSIDITTEQNNFEHKPSLVLKIPEGIESKLHSPRSNRSILSNPSRNGMMSIKSNSKSRHPSMKSNKRDIYVPLKDYQADYKSILEPLNHA